MPLTSERKLRLGSVFGRKGISERSAKKRNQGGLMAAYDKVSDWRGAADVKGGMDALGGEAGPTTPGSAYGVSGPHSQHLPLTE